MTTLTQLVLVGALVAGGLLGEQWTGWIGDRGCAKNGNYAGEEHKKCVDGGQPVVFVDERDKKVYLISNPDKVKELVGKKVTLTGTASGETIEAVNVTEAK